MSYFRNQADRLSLFARHAVSWSIRQIYRLLYVISYPAVRGLFTFVAVIVLANIMYVTLKVLFSPVGLVHEEVYFDYMSEEGPVANLTLASVGQQWQLGRGEGGALVGVEEDCSEISFFGKHSEYDISMSFTLARSARNWEAGKCMAYLTLADCRGGRVARAARSLHLPYQGDTLRLADSLLRLPLHLARLLHESDTVHVDMMRGYSDAVSSLPPAHSLQVSLSKNAVLMDIERIYIHIDPRPKGLAYLFYSFPFSSFFAINVLFVTIFMWSSSCMFVLGYAMQRGAAAAAPGPSDDGDKASSLADEDDHSKHGHDEGVSESSEDRSSGDSSSEGSSSEDSSSGGGNGGGSRTREYCEAGAEIDDDLEASAGHQVLRGGQLRRRRRRRAGQRPSSPGSSTPGL